MKNYREYMALSQKESSDMADRAIHEIADPEALSDILLHLALFTDGQCLVKQYPKLIEMGIFYPCEIYIHANEDIAQHLIELIEQKPTEVNVNHLLTCLAWIGTENVLAFFVSSSHTRPIWTEQLYVLPSAYAGQAGWIIGSDNQKRSLINRKVIPLTKESELSDTQSTIETFKSHPRNCPFCKNTLTTLFAVGIESDDYQTEFSTCLLCGCYEPIYMRIENNGNSLWHEANRKWEYLSDDLTMDPIEENSLKASLEPRKPEHTISQFVNSSKSQIGGFPTWIQDAEYLDCPDCQEKMSFIGQIDMEDVLAYGEGIYYCQYCPTCKITGINYQQT
jgi:glutaredoxin